jgi:1-acyl-sn-glycerol-3-phosphate acyltransferase
MLSRFRAAIRLLIFPLVTLLCAVVALTMRLLGFSHRWVYSVFQFWKRAMRIVLNIHVVQEGPVPHGAAVIMANHRSYLDVVMIPSKTPVVFVAKQSVKRWPIVGWGGDAMKTIWVNRNDEHSRKRTRKRILERLEEGQSIIIFPEGTTSVGPDVLPFKPGMFYAVAASPIAIVPVAIEYKNPNMAWVGQDTFIPHFLREFGAPKTEVKVGFGEPMQGDDGEKLKEQVYDWVRNSCARYRADWDRK